MKIHIEYLDNDINDYLTNIVNTRENFSLDKFMFWLETHNIKSKTNPNSYVKACFVKELNKGVFDEEKIEFISNTIPFYNYLRKLGIRVHPDDTLYFDILLTYIGEKKLLTSAQIAEQLGKGVHYAIEHEQKSLKEFIQAFMKSKTIRGLCLNTTELKNLYHDQLEEWKGMLNVINN